MAVSHRLLTTGSCGRRGQRTVFPDAFVAGAAQPGRKDFRKRPAKALFSAAE